MAKVIIRVLTMFLCGVFVQDYLCGQPVRWMRGRGEAVIRKIVEHEDAIYVVSESVDIYSKTTHAIVKSLYKGDYVASIAVSPNGDLVCVALEDRLSFLSSVDYEQLFSLPIDFIPADISWSPDGNHLAILSVGGRMQLWDIEGAREIWSYNVPGGGGVQNISKMRFTHDGNYLVYRARSFGIIRVSSGASVFQNVDPYIVDPSFDINAENGEVAVAMDFEKIHLLRPVEDGIDTLESIRVFGDPVTALSFYDDSPNVLVAQGKVLSRVSLVNHQVSGRSSMPNFTIREIVNLHDSSRVLLIDKVPSLTWIVSTDSMKTVESLDSYSHTVRRLAWKFDGSEVAGSDWRNIVVHSNGPDQHGAPLYSVRQSNVWNVRDMKYSRDGRYLACVSGRSVLVWNAEDYGDPIAHEFDTPGLLYQVDWVPGTDLVIVAGDSISVLCKISDEGVKVVGHLPSTIAGFVTASDGGHIFAFDLQGNLARYSTDDWMPEIEISELRVEAPLVGLHLSVLDRYVAAVDISGKISIWDTFEQHLHRVVEHSGGILSSTGVPNSYFILTGGYDARILLWDLRTGDVAYEMKNRPLRPSSISCSYDQRQLAVGYGDGLIVYDAPWQESNVSDGVYSSNANSGAVQVVSGREWNVEFDGLQEPEAYVDVEIFDVLGRSAWATQCLLISRNKARIVVPLLVPGLYWVSARVGDMCSVTTVYLQ